MEEGLFLKSYCQVVGGLCFVVAELTTDASGDVAASAIEPNDGGVASVARATAAYSVVMRNGFKRCLYATMYEPDGTPEGHASWTQATKTLLFNMAAAVTSSTIQLFAVFQLEDV